jgi:TM2 domain-containing membrane protein YozV
MTICTSCGAENADGVSFCVKCGTALPAAPTPEAWRQSGELNQASPNQAGSGPAGQQYTPPYAQPPSYPSYGQQGMQYPQHGGMDWKAQGADKKIAAGICGILLGSLGIHKFILGYTTEAVIMLLVSLVGGFLTCGITTIVVNVIGIVEGIIYLTKSDEEFVRTYILQKKGWF